MQEKKNAEKEYTVKHTQYLVKMSNIQEILISQRIDQKQYLK